MRQKVVIIGGGVSGLTAAHELIERDLDVSLYVRLLPGRYRHLPDTLKRIPYKGKRRPLRQEAARRLRAREASSSAPIGEASKRRQALKSPAIDSRAAGADKCAHHKCRVFGWRQPKLREGQAILAATEMEFGHASLAVGASGGIETADKSATALTLTSMHEGLIGNEVRAAMTYDTYQPEATFNLTFIGRESEEAVRILVRASLPWVMPEKRR